MPYPPTTSDAHHSIHLLTHLQHLRSLGRSTFPLTHPPTIRTHSVMQLTKLVSHAQPTHPKIGSARLTNRLTPFLHHPLLHIYLITLLTTHTQPFHSLTHLDTPRTHPAPHYTFPTRSPTLSVSSSASPFILVQHHL